MLISLVWTSFRTSNCRLAWRGHVRQIALPFDVPRRRGKGLNDGERFLRCAGLDLDKKSVQACVRIMEPSGHKRPHACHRRPFAPETERLDAVLGVDRRVAEVALAEVGANTNAFPTHQQVTAWVETCPGNEESTASRPATAG
jgi:Transposase IS116/IS110/IS902 family